MTINSRRILQIYKSLDKEQIHLVFTKKIEGKLEIQQWLEKLHKLAVMDHLGDDTRIKAGDLSIVFGIFTAFTIFLTISKPFLFFFPVGFFLLFFYFLIMYITLNRIDIGNNLRIFIVPLLENYKEENSVNALIDLKMDFSNPKKHKNLIKQMEGQDESGRIFKHHWMEGKLTFTDQIMIQWNIEDVVEETRKNFKKRTGNQIGQKEKNSIRHKLDLKFLVPKNKFELLNKEAETTESEEYIIIQINRESSSNTLEEGMSPLVFLNAIKEGYEKIIKREEISS